MNLWLLTSPGFGERDAPRGLLQRAAEEGHRLLPVIPERCRTRLAAGSLATEQEGRPLDLPEAAIHYRVAKGSHASFLLARQLEAAGVLVLNSVRASLLGRDKAATLQLAAAAGLPIPRTTCLPLGELSHAACPDLPVVVKTAVGSQGRGVHLCRTADELERTRALIAADTGDAQVVLLQEYVSEAPGEDLRVYVVGGEAIGGVRRAGAPGSWKANLARGGRAWEVELEAEAADLAVAACERLGLELGGVDLLFGPAGYLFNEVNPAPQFHVSEPGAPRSYDVPSRLFARIEELLSSPLRAND